MNYGSHISIGSNTLAFIDPEFAIEKCESIEFVDHKGVRLPSRRNMTMCDGIGNRRNDNFLVTKILLFWTDII